MPSVRTLSNSLLLAQERLVGEGKFWDRQLIQHVYGTRTKVQILNLEKTLPRLMEAITFIRQLSARSGTILMVGTKRNARTAVALEAQRCGMPYVNQRWLGGALTNFKTVKGILQRLKDMQATKKAGTHAMIKKEQLLFDRELARLEKDLGGIQDMSAIPDAIFVIDVVYHKSAVDEANKLGIPVVGIVNTNHSFVGIDYAIPGNDDSAKAVALYLRAVADAVLEGKANATNEVVQAVSTDGDEFVEVGEEDSYADSYELLAMRTAAKPLVGQHRTQPANTALAEALGRGWHLLNQALGSEEMLTAEAFALRAQITVQRLHQLRRSESILGLPDTNDEDQYRFPRWQLDDSLVNRMHSLLAVLGDLSPWAKWHFFQTSSPILFELSPLEAMGLAPATEPASDYGNGRIQRIVNVRGSIWEAVIEAAELYSKGQD